MKLVVGSFVLFFFFFVCRGFFSCRPERVRDRKNVKLVQPIFYWNVSSDVV